MQICTNVKCKPRIHYCIQQNQMLSVALHEMHRPLRASGTGRLRGMQGLACTLRVYDDGHHISLSFSQILSLL